MAARWTDSLAPACEALGLNRSYQRNALAGVNLTDEEMRDILNPWAEMQVHVSCKCAELLATAGLGIGLLLARRPNRLRKAGQAAVLGNFLGAGPVAFAAWKFKSSALSEEDIFDRAYRVRYNRIQLRIDSFYGGGFCFGLLGGLITTRSLGGSVADAGIVSVGGLLGAVAYTAYQRPDKHMW
eukprot:TRINITY_DN65801_c0_g1_i1.p1 TRINITY_DN65801_c0_g1~~TRINITY_DN65801_c0_g1_i1.p1  ORF type:complete len:197 (-),score=22.34 TRINITY_DN65801_c0_g1_i1:44-592(-)